MDDRYHYPSLQPVYTIGIKLNLITTKKHLQSFASSFLYFLIIIIGNATVVDVTLRLNFETDIAQTKEGVVQLYTSSLFFVCC